jgi:hypothetical protein
MKRYLLVAIILLAVSLSFPDEAIAAEEQQVSFDQGAVLCMPDIYFSAPDDCLPLGPSESLTNYARQGIFFPIRPLSGTSLDPKLALLNVQYARLGPDTTPVYASLDDALAGAAPMSSIPAGDMRYITYIRMAETDSGRWFQMENGGWVSVETRVGLPSGFRGGILFNETPTTSFGWILPFRAEFPPKRTPGYHTQDYINKTFAQYELVQIYETVTVGNDDWHLIGPDEWVERRNIGRVYPNTTPPDGVENGRWIEINIYEQTLSVYDEHELVFATLIATGRPPFHTRPGLFPIYETFESNRMSGAFELDRSDFYYLDDVPWTLYYDGAIALHGTYWRSNMGYKQSLGCVNLAVIDARWVFDWAELGDWVYVWDPSGETPTDPDLYISAGP